GLSRTWAAPAERLAVSVIGTAVDAPSSDIALGILGLLALAAGRPAPQAEEWERAGAQGGAADGRSRPTVLADQPAVSVAAARGGSRAAAGDSPAPTDGSLPATQVAELVAGTYDSLWGRTRVVVLGGRLFSVDEAVTDPAATALELCVSGVRADPIEAGMEAVELATWGDSGYGTWAEPILARLVRADAGAGDGAVGDGGDGDGDSDAGDGSWGDGGDGGVRLRCAGLVVTGQVRTPSADFVMPERVTAP